jgi:integrase
MNASIAAVETSGQNIITLPETKAKKTRKRSTRLKARFSVVPFTNSSRTVSYRINGKMPDGSRVRENFKDQAAAEARRLELEMEFRKKLPTDNLMLRATELNDAQLRIAELGFRRLPTPDDMTLAIDLWLKSGKPAQTKESPRLDTAVNDYLEFLDKSDFRDATKQHWKTRIKKFRQLSPDFPVSEFTPDHIAEYLGKCSPGSKDTDRRCVSRFFSFCIEKKWLTTNPAKKQTRSRNREQTVISVLTVDQCKALLHAAEQEELAVYMSICLFAGLRPSEAARLDWKAINLKDRTIRLEHDQTKTHQSRVVTINDTLHGWLKKYEDKPIVPPNFRKKFDKVKLAAGFGTPDDEHPDLVEWPADAMRHTCISFHFQKHKSFGLAAEEFGNSESVIKKHYKAKVRSEDMEPFYKLLPSAN